ncbi:MAG TPA: hypothetical protein VNR64_03375 [Vicinamibacterales bacterium]|nr:hypothetical protein [Vicinamibacterales bacterium]
MMAAVVRRVAAVSAAGILAVWMVTVVGVRAEGAEPDVMVRSEVSPTAMYVGDRVAFTVTLTLRRQLDVLPEDLAVEKLNVEGLDALTRELTKSEDGDGTTTYVVRYLLTTYRVDVPLPKIAPMAVRYYVRRAGQDPRDAVPAGTVQVPGAVIAFRSVLPDGHAIGARDARTPATRAGIYSLLHSLGLGLVVLGVVPVVLIAIEMLRGARHRVPAAGQPAHRRRSRQQARSIVAALAAESPQTVEQRRDAFARLDAAVRDHIVEVWQVPVRNLAADQAATLLDQQGGSCPAGAAAYVLRRCELALYGPSETVPSSDEWRETLARGEQIVTAG